MLVGAALLASRALRRSRRPHRWTAPAPDVLNHILASPAQLLVLSFALLAALGTALLLLPSASSDPGSLSLVDAAFTAVSASCVTGLAVVDTPGDLTGLGQAVVLGLIQVGGLGIMTFAAAASIFMGRRLLVREEKVAAEFLGGQEVRRDLTTALSAVLGVTLGTEVLGAVALTTLFVSGGEPWGPALWRATFTSISAFCNAGFALQSDSLVPYQDQPAVLIVVGTLIVVGGLGPLVVVALPGWLRGRGSLHLRLVGATTLVFLLVPWLAFLALEWGHGLAGLGFADKLVNAGFQSVTLRTAGFNSVDYASLRGATWTIMLLSMFVGGSPGSTAGGVKTTTFAVLLLALVATIRGRSEVEAFGRRIPKRTVYEAVAITTMGVLSAMGVLLALQLTQDLPLNAAIFETVSALGTVGLTLGATSELNVVGQILVMVAMFAGRVGPLTLFVFLLDRQRPARRFPVEAVQVG